MAGEVKAREPIDVLRKAFPGLRWRKLRWVPVYAGKGRGISLEAVEGKAWTMTAWAGACRLMLPLYDARLPRLCARTADRLWAIANACEAAQQHPAPTLRRIVPVF